MSKSNKKHTVEYLWDLWCIFSIIGIWPRFIEPSMLLVSDIEIKLKGLPKDLDGLKIIQFSDLHFHADISKRFLKKLTAKINGLNPDIILFSGDFLCHSRLVEEDLLAEFFNSLKATYGCYAVLGNHDYQECVGINKDGDFDVIIDDDAPLIKKGFQRLFSNTAVSGIATEKARAIKKHEMLNRLLEEKTKVKLLHNKSCLIPIKSSFINLCGLGEHSFGDVLPEAAFASYNKAFPGIILLHNPDAVPLLKGYPGDIVLSGHTHGGQVNLPLMWKKFILMKHQEFKSGLVKFHDKWVYINRGVGSSFPFRWFAPPEILELTLTAAD